MIRQDTGGLATSTHSVCVIGSGPAGVALALTLEKLGHRVLVLESGGLRRSEFTQSLSVAAFADASLHDDMGDAVARQLGGTSNFWGGRCPPYDALDFENRAWVSDARWPIGLGDIAPFYPAACEVLSCGSPVFAAADNRLDATDGDFTATSLERWSNLRPVQKAHAAALASSKLIDIHLDATVVDIAFSENGSVSHVVVAHRDGTRTRVPVKRLVIAAGGLETTRLLLNAQRFSPRRFGGPDGPLGRYYMGHVIGEISDITFSDDALDAAFDFFIDANGSYVRRRLVPSPEVQRAHQLGNIAFFPVVPMTCDARHGSGLLSLVCLAMSYPAIGRRLVAEAIRQRHVPADLDRWPHVRNLIRDLPHAAVHAPWLLWKRYGARIRHPGFYVRNRARRYGLSYHAEHFPNALSRVTLSSDRDAFDMPRLNVDIRFSDADFQSVVNAHDLLSDWLRRNRIGSVAYRGEPANAFDMIRRQTRHGTHQIGTARMGRSGAEGVVDGNLQAFDSPNLYVASSAAFPTSSQANPTLTIVALAVRLGHHLARLG